MKFGRFAHDEVYSMPVQLRNFYYKKLVESNEKEKREIDKVSGGNESKPKQSALIHR